MIARYLLVSACCFLVVRGAAQTTATLSGSVVDATTNTPLSGAYVEVFVADSSMGSTTNANGTFRMTDLPTGIHRVRASFVGYAPAEITEVWVRAGKEESVELSMQRSANELGEAEVRALAPQRLDAIGTHVLTVEKSLRYPATFFDPARLAMSFAGVASTNDQANHFSVRGNGPAGNAWLLEGAEIVNPNHTGNAGTQNDLPTLSGGGTTILSAQMLGTSRLLLGGFSAPYGNALGGIMDMHLRAGTKERHAFTVQAGLIGIDLSAEGPFKKGKGATYLINYRYSTLGLLGAMGVALGDEKITFQDLSFNVSIPFKDKAQLTFFGMGGNSSNVFDAKDSTEWEFDKDSQNIDYTSQVGAAGTTFRLALGKNAVWKTTAVISENDQERTETGPFFARRGSVYTVRNALSEQKLSLVSYVRGSIGSRTNYQLGGSAMQRIMRKTILIDEVIDGWLMRPYGEVAHDLTERLRASVGLAYSYYTPNGSEVLEPRVTMSWRTLKGRTLTLSAGQRGQLPRTQLFPATQFIGLDNSSIGMTRIQEIVLAYDHPFKPHLVMHGEVFVQQLVDVPISSGSGFFGLMGTGSGSLVNGWDTYYFEQLSDRGKATNKGVELSLDHSFHNNFFYQINGTVLDATYTDVEDRTLNSRWNTRAIGNVVIGREFVKEKERLKRTWGINMRANLTGGQRYTPITDPASQLTDPYSSQYPTFYRLDLRVYLKRERKAHTGMWSLDLLNATNAQNVSYQYFDVRKREVVTKYQLGLIPNVSYRIEF